MKDEFGSEMPNKDGKPFDEVVPLVHRDGTYFYGNVTLGNWTMFKVFAMPISPGKFFIAVQHHGCYAFESWVHWEYAAEKLALLPADARNMADWINVQLGVFDQEREQGRYGSEYRTNKEEPYGR